MALSRLGDPADAACMAVEALNPDGDPVALLSLVPWGERGLSLDLMRRDQQGANGLTEEQRAFKEHCLSQGYRLVVAYNWVDAATEIINYLGIRDAYIDDALSINRRATIRYSTPDPLQRL